MFKQVHNIKSVGRP